MNEVEVVDTPSPNGQAPEPANVAEAQKDLKDFTTDELWATRRQMMDTARQVDANLNLVTGILIGRGEDVSNL